MKIIKQISTLICMMLLVNGSAVAMKDGFKLISLSVPTMNCAMCPVTVAKSLTNIDGVQTADVNLEQGIVMVSFNDQITNIKAMTQATKMAGYPSYLIKK